MNEKQQQLIFDKGITNVPNDALCSDNALTESLNLVYEDGEHKVIQQPVSLFHVPTDVGTNTIRYIHKYNTEKRYIVVHYDRYYGYSLYWGTINNQNLVLEDELEGVTINNYSDEEKLKFTSVGKTLIVTDGSGMHYYLWKGATYKYLGGRIPTQDVFFKLSSRSRQFVTNSQDSTGIFENNSVATNKRETFNDMVIGLYSKNKKAIDQRKSFCLPFLVRTALRLYDGTYTNISQPVMMFPSVRENTSMDKQLGNNHDTTSMRTYYQDLLYENRSFEQYATGVGSFFEDWTDVVKDIVIFISDGVEIHDLSVDQKWAQGFNYEVSSTTFIDRVSYDSVSGTTKYIKEDNIQGFRVLEFYSDDEIASELTSRSNFYKLCAIGLFEYGDYNVSNKIEKHYLENLTTQEMLENDDFFSHCSLCPETIFTYNSRLNISNVKRSMFEGFDYFYPITQLLQSGYKGDVRFYVTIETDSGQRIVKHEAYSMHVQGLYFYYPDSRAKHVSIFRKYQEAGVQDPPVQWKRILDADLKEHDWLNGAYYYKGLPADNNNNSESYTSADQPEVNDADEVLGNYIIQSDVNNPFVFKAEGYFKVGTGKIMAMSSITQALSEGQFGQFPLLVFSESGVWALTVGNTGYYDSIHPLSRDVCNNPNAVTQTDGAVFFTSQKGLMVVVGSQVKCVSEQLSGKESRLGMFGNQAFQKFLENAFIAYDYRDSLLWIFNKIVTQVWVYSIKSGTFSLCNYVVGSYVVNDYPDSLVSNGATMYSFMERPNINSDSNIYTADIETRPLKLENALALKSILQIKHITDFTPYSVTNNGVTTTQQGSLTLRIFASNNLTDWFELTSLHGTPWKYYKFRYDFANLRAVDTFSGTLLITQERRINKLR